MANLLRFISESLKTGSGIDLYLGRAIRIGDGRVLGLEPLLANVQGKGSIFGHEFNASIEIKMPDQSPMGTCTIAFGGGVPEKSQYRTNGNQLQFSYRNLVLYADGHWTWVWVEADQGKAWAGLWPQGMNLAGADASAEAPPAPAPGVWP